jgi:hypothetical protein
VGAFSMHIPLALEGQWSGAAAVGVVLTAAAIFIGTLYYILATLFGWRRAYYITMVSLMGFIILLSLVWLAGVPGSNPGFGPRGREPAWVPFLANSEFGADFREQIATFPDGWDAPGEKYFGNPDKGKTGSIDSAGEIETIKTVLRPALAGYFQARPQLGGTVKEEDYDFRIPGTAAQEAALTAEEKAVPAAVVRFEDAGGGNLLGGFQIPAVSGKHPAITVFAYRDKGAVFLPSLYFLMTSLVLFALHLWLLARDEIKQRARDAETVTKPTTVTAGR